MLSKSPQEWGQGGAGSQSLARLLFTLVSVLD